MLRQIKNAMKVKRTNNKQSLALRIVGENRQNKVNKYFENIFRDRKTPVCRLQMPTTRRTG